MILLLYTHFNSKLDDVIFNNYLARLPLETGKKIKRYVRWQDRQLGLFGKLLLVEGLQRLGHRGKFFHDILFNDYGRPYIPGPLDFNISHSGQYSVCAFSDIGNIGVDIERKRKIEVNDFKRYLTNGDWETIWKSNDRIESFFRIWTIKESVAKARGKGLSVPLTDIHIKDSRALLDNEWWFIKEIFIDKDYLCHLCVGGVDVCMEQIEVVEVDFTDTEV